MRIPSVAIIRLDWCQETLMLHSHWPGRTISAPIRLCWQLLHCSGYTSLTARQTWQWLRWRSIYDAGVVRYWPVIVRQRFCNEVSSTLFGFFWVVRLDNSVYFTQRKSQKLQQWHGTNFSVAVNDLLYRDEIVGARQLLQPTETGLDGAWLQVSQKNVGEIKLVEQIRCTLSETQAGMTNSQGCFTRQAGCLRVFPSLQKIGKFTEKLRFPICRRPNRIHCVVSLVFPLWPRLDVEDVPQLNDERQEGHSSLPSCFSFINTVELHRIARRFAQHWHGKFDRRFLYALWMQSWWSQRVSFLQSHRLFQLIQFNSARKRSTTSFRQVVGHRRAVKDFSGLQIIVHVVEVVHRVKQQKQRLSSNGVDDVSCQFSVAQTVDVELSVDSCIIHRDSYNPDCNRAE